MSKLRVIIGQGTASEVYQFTGSQGEFETIVIGPRGLWSVLPATHAMGQPPHLLALPGQQVPGFQAPTGKTPQGLQKFLDVNTYQSNLRELSKSQTGPRVEYPNLKVTSIEPGDNDSLMVKVTDPTCPSLAGFKADQVVIASGIGPQKQLPDVKIPVEGTPDTTLGFKQIEEGIDYLTHADRLGNEVIVYGGAATGAWVAAEVYEHMQHKKDWHDWYWMAAPGGSGFSKSVLPGDRNAAIVQQTQFQKRYEIKKAVYRAKEELRKASDGDSGRPDRPMVELTLKGEQGNEFPYFVDQLIFCIGGNPASSGSIAAMLDDSLIAKLAPLEDQNRMVSDGKGVLAWSTPKRDLIIIGAATFNFQEPFFKKQVQAAPMATLPPNAQVPDGIAVAISTIEALNAYMPVKPLGVPTGPGFAQSAAQKVKWNINFNTSNRTQIAAYIASTTDTEPFTANLQVALIVYLRSKNNFGLNESQVELILKNVADNIRILRGNNPDLDAKRLGIDKVLGPDKHLQFYIDAMTQSDSWKSLWTSGGIQC